MQLFGREANWGHLARNVLVYNSYGMMPTELNPLLDHDYLKPEADGLVSERVQVKDNIWHVNLISIQNRSEMETGFIITINDITAEEEAIKQLLWQWAVIAIATIILFIIFYFFFYYRKNNKEQEIEKTITENEILPKIIAPSQSEEVSDDSIEQEEVIKEKIAVKEPKKEAEAETEILKKKKSKKKNKKSKKRKKRA